MDLCELLDLDAKVVYAHAQAYEGYAVAIGDASQGSDRLTLLALQSHYMAIAASYWSAVEPPRAEKIFAESSRYAQKLASLYENESSRDPTRALSWNIQAALLGLSGNDSSRAEDFLRRTNAEATLPASTVLSALLVTLRVAQATRQNELAGKMFSILASRLQNEKMDRLPVGVLQLPLSYYVQLGWMVGGLEKDPSGSRIEEWGVEFSRRLDERIAIAQASRLHWRMLYSRLLPIEPEALLAVGAWWQTLLRIRGSDGNRLEVFTSNLSSAMRAYIGAAAAIFQIRDRPNRN